MAKAKNRKPKKRQTKKRVHPVIQALIGYYMQWSDKSPLVPGDTIFDSKKSHQKSLWRMDMNYMNHLVKEIAAQGMLLTWHVEIGIVYTFMGEPFTETYEYRKRLAYNDMEPVVIELCRDLKTELPEGASVKHYTFYIEVAGP